MGKNNRKNQRNSAPDNSASSEDERTDKIEFEGQVVESLPAAQFRVQVQGGAVILAVLGGRLRLNKIRILPGDLVKVEVSPYDLTRGRIVWRR